MQLILAWVLFPFVLALIGVGWGFLVERLAGARLSGCLLLPLGLAAALVVAGTLSAYRDLAAGSARRRARGPRGPASCLGRKAAAGRLVLARGRRRLLAFGAPVLLSGQATFAGFVRLDDTAAWFNIIDHLPSGPHVAGSELPSTYSLQYSTAGRVSPRGVPPARRDAPVIGADIAWVFQAYLASCAAAIALCLYGLIEPLVPSARMRALVAFLAAQAALLYGYSLWGGVRS